MGTSKSQQVPVNVRGSSVFGVYPKISSEITINMFQSDGWMINYAGYKSIAETNGAGTGRGFFRSIRGGFMVAVIGSQVYTIDSSLNAQPVQGGINAGKLDTSSGEVFLDENLSKQICIVDGVKAYILSYDSNGNFTLTPQTLTRDNTNIGTPIIPGYVCYHNSFFLIASALTSQDNQNWYVFSRKDDTHIQLNIPLAGSTFPIQTKPDSAIAVRRIPGKGNNVIVFGKAVCEVWAQVGGALNYQRVQSYNIDSGCISVSTISASEEYVCWLAQNENNNASITVSNGSSTQIISTDGIDHLLDSLVNPSQSTAFFYRQDGHLFYHLTFFDPRDNLTLVYDFDDKLFYNASDENNNYYPARQVVFFGTHQYFISLNDSKIFEMGEQFTTYKYTQLADDVGFIIPRIRICKAIRKEDSSTFRAGMFTFWIEQGLDTQFKSYPIADSKYIVTQQGKNTRVEIRDDKLITESASNATVVCNGVLVMEQSTPDNVIPIITELGDTMLAEFGVCYNTNTDYFYQPRVDMSFSKNGNQSFSNIVSRGLNPLGTYRNQIRWHQMGQANELTIQLRFWGFSRLVVNDGIAEIY